jgi:hypothetical protein
VKIPSITGGAAGPAVGGSAGIGGSTNDNGGLVIIKGNPVLTWALASGVIFLLWVIFRKKK